MSEQKKMDAERAAFEAIEWLDDFVARCNGDDRGSCESVNIIRRALQARASRPVGVPGGIAEQHAKAMKLLREAHSWVIPKGNISVSIFERIGAFLDSAAAPSAPAGEAVPVAGELTRVKCPCCPYEYEADSYDAGFIAGSGMCQVCDAAMPAKDLPAAGVEAPEVVAWMWRDLNGDMQFNYMHPEGQELMTVAQHERIVATQQSSQPELTVWEGQMPESNGKSNFTAVLMRKGAGLFDGIAGGMTIARSEYPDRVRYEADCVRWLIGELDEQPCIIDYDADKHSGYVAQHSAPERVSVPVELLERLVNPEAWLQDLRKSQSELRALLARHGRGEANG